MREPDICVNVRERLARHGLPAGRIDRIMRELTEHWEDLRADALESGLPPLAARVEADKHLGTPEDLTANFILHLRRGSWLGRHPLLSVCILPLLLSPALMAAVILPVYWITKWGEWISWNQPGALDVEIMVNGLWVVYYLTLMLSTGWLCWRSWRAGLGARWITAMCSWCALMALFRFFNADPFHRNVVVGLSFPWRLDSHTAAILILHLIIAGGFLLAGQRCSNRRNGELEEVSVLAGLNSSIED